MNNNKPETRLKGIIVEQDDLHSPDINKSLQKEVSFRKAIENAIPSGIAVVDDTGKQVYVNQSFCNMVGWEEDELLGKRPPYSYWPPEEIENISQAMKETLDDNAPIEGFDLIFSHKTGKRIPVQVIIAPFKQNDGKTFFLANVIDITDRKLTDQKLKESETKFKEIIDQSNDGIIVFDEQGKIIIWNKGAEEICGVNADFILKQNIVDIKSQFVSMQIDDKSTFENEIKEIISLQNPEVFDQILEDEIIPFNSEEVRNVQSKVFPIRLNGYNLFCYVFRDITAAKHYEKELLRVSEDKDKFYSTIAQYLYTPFNLFHNFTKLMVEELDTLPIKEIQKMAVMMSRSATNLYSLLDNLLQWTKMNQGKITYRPQKLDFLKISHDSVSILKPDADAKNITINHSVSDEISVFADFFMIKTILRNLVSNAIRSTEHGESVSISATEESPFAIISVQDKGNRSTAEYVNKLFTSSQINSFSGITEEKGSTLGLLLCKEFVDKHGGSIWVETEDDRSNIYKFTLPLFNERRKNLT
jgi:PAS domain S-box-containing protein